MGQNVSFEDIGRLPAAGDNTAIAVRRLEAGTRVHEGSISYTLNHTVPEGHRFAVQGIAEGKPLLSWGLPFGWATRDIEPGEYLCNPKILCVLSQRRVDFALPTEANFNDGGLAGYAFDEASFVPGDQIPRYSESGTFMGYRRGGSRGVGTRNYIVILGVTSRTAGYARALERQLSEAAAVYGNIDGIAAVAHTEGGEESTPNNLQILLRTLSGFVIHPNVGAVMVVNEEDSAVTNDMLLQYMQEHRYPLSEVPHKFLNLRGSFSSELGRGEKIVREWLDEVNATERTCEPLSELKIGLQCGGSDAFSGISANPLVAWVARELIRHGGTANLAETDELIGAERYILDNVRDLQTAQGFLAMVERFKAFASRHGHTAEGNVSGGNSYRGLYNISIKSIGAARKKAPDVRLDHVIEYAERMREGGYYFMDSPGNDLESIGGQVAAGANMVFFTTGNGSITNFPFVPTVKVVTTSGRYDLLSSDMDVNAGAYLDGSPLDELGRDTFELTVGAASGERTVGERAGHSQVHIWRDWKQTLDSSGKDLSLVENRVQPDGRPLQLKEELLASNHTFEAMRTANGYAADQVGLIMPTSLCSGQIALRIANRLNESDVAEGKLSRFVALAHTEGCGVSGGSPETLYSRTVLGHLSHPLVGLGLLLEHGCEKTHNDYFRSQLLENGLDPKRFGWASIQLDGGIDSVVKKVEDWFARTLEGIAAPEHETVGMEHLQLGLTAEGPLAEEAALSLARLTGKIVAAGGTIVVPERSSLLSSQVYLDALLKVHSPEVTLAYGQKAQEPGLHVMEAPTDHWVETATGLGATGAEVMLAHVSGRPLQSHSMIPTIQVSAEPEASDEYGEDFDLLLNAEPGDWSKALVDLVIETASRRYTPKLFKAGNTNFQFTRGLLGVSM